MFIIFSGVLKKHFLAEKREMRRQGDGLMAFLADDTVQIYENELRNTGFPPGKYLDLANATFLSSDQSFNPENLFTIYVQMLVYSKFVLSVF